MTSKTVQIGLTILCACAAVRVTAQSNFAQRVSTLWLTGDKAAVLRIATDRLARNTNDIAGLLLKAEHEIECLHLTAWTGTMSRVIQASSRFTGTNYAAVLPLVRADYERLRSLIPYYPPNEFEADKAKALINEKPLACADAIEALQKDGYFQEPQQCNRP